jgi:hypothetical protein
MSIYDESVHDWLNEREPRERPDPREYEPGRDEPEVPHQVWLEVPKGAE